MKEIHRFDRPAGAAPTDDAAGDPMRRPDDTGGPTPPQARTEPVLATIGAAAALVAQMLTGVAHLWLLLDVAAVIAALIAVRTLLRALAVERGRPVLTEVATLATALGIALALVLVGRHGPEDRVGALVLTIAAGALTALSLLLIGGVVLRAVREQAGEPSPVGSGPYLPETVGPVPVTGATTMAITAIAALVAVALPAWDALVR